MPYTYGYISVSLSTYEEIRQKLIDAGYKHAINEKGEIDMHGIALVRQDPNQAVEFLVTSLIASRNHKPRIEMKYGPIRVQVDTDAAMDIAQHIIECCMGSYADGFIFNYIKERVKLDDGRAAQVIQDFREYRDKLNQEFKENQHDKG